MPANDEIIGFNLADATAIIDQLDGNKSRQKVDHRRQPHYSNMLGVVKTGGLAAGSEGSVWISSPTASGWSTSSDSCPCWTIGASLIAGDSVILVPVDGRWLALKVC
jgi:hypothetical protein